MLEIFAYTVAVVAGIAVLGLAVVGAIAIYVLSGLSGFGGRR